MPEEILSPTEVVAKALDGLVDERERIAALGELIAAYPTREAAMELAVPALNSITPGLRALEGALMAFPSDALAAPPTGPNEVRIAFLCRVAQDNLHHLNDAPDPMALWKETERFLKGAKGWMGVKARAVRAVVNTGMKATRILGA